ncbi:MAG: hemerythrin domain-containing protein [Bacteroidota bacterium]
MKIFNEQAELLGTEKLMAYISEHFHLNARERLGAISDHLHTAEKVDAALHPEVGPIRDLFEEFRTTLLGHIEQEEFILFPFIRKLNEARADDKSAVDEAEVRMIENPVRQLAAGWGRLADMMDALHRHSSGFRTHINSSPTLKQCYRELSVLHSDLREYMHLEKDILFPTVLELEEELLARNDKLKNDKT